MATEWTKGGLAVFDAVLKEDYQESIVQMLTAPSIFTLTPEERAERQRKWEARKAELDAIWFRVAPPTTTPPGSVISTSTA